MRNDEARLDVPSAIRTDRREVVLESALLTFAHFGYRKASMEAVARAAHISRPGLYFLFSSKEELFRTAVTHALDVDLLAIDGILKDAARPLPARLLEAFDRWAGRYIGPMTRDITVVIEDNPDLLGTIVESAPQHFAELIKDAVAAETTEAGMSRAWAVAQTLISASIGIKHQVKERTTYLQRLEVAIDLLVH
jgi:AcrR family transcriptional regulator